MANPDLPREIIFEIFSKLPTKSVGKCRTLSKYWKTHLSTNSFIKKHMFTRKQTIQQENVVLTTQWDKVCIITSPTTKDEALHSKSFPGSWLRVRGSCNGLILVNGSKGLILTNPITLKQVTIQENVTPENNDLGFYDSIVYGFGYDSCSDDYKIVQICSYSSMNGDGLATTFVDVYSVKNGVWKRVDCYPYGGFVPKRYGFECGAFVNGTLHWLICSKEGYRSCIAAFDLANEVFREIPLPKEFVRQPVNNVVRFGRDESFSEPRSNGVSVVCGCLLIVDNYGNGMTDVWIMKEYGVAESWVRFCIEAEDGNWHSIVAMMCYVEDGELLFLTSWDYLFACDLKGGTLRKVLLDEDDTWFSDGISFVDSHVSPEGSW